MDALKGLEFLVQQIDRELEGKDLNRLDSTRAGMMQDMLGHVAIAQQLSRIADTLDRISRDYREDLFSRHAHLSITRGRKKRL